MVCVGQTLVALVALAGAQLPHQALLLDDEVFSAVSNLTALTWRMERRLATDAMDFAKMCQSPCWSDMKTGMIKMFKNMDSPECKAMMTPMCGVVTTTTTTTTTSTILSQCTKDRKANAQKWVQNQISEFEGCNKSIMSATSAFAPVLTGTPAQMCAGCPMMAATLGGGSDPCLSAVLNMARPCGAVGMPGMTPGMFQCMKQSVDFLCDTMCGAKCKNDNWVMMMLTGGDGVPSTATTTTTTAPTSTATTTTTTAATCDQNHPMSPDSMGNMLNFMCVKGPNAAKASTSEGFYCQAKIMELQKGAAAMQGASPSDEYPDPCSIDCSTMTSQAIKTLGCCTAGMIDMMSTDPKMANHIKTVKAVAWKCGGVEALTLCDGGSLVTAEWLQGKSTVAKCPKTNTEEIAEVRKIANNIEVSAEMVSITICTTAVDKGCQGRRLGRQLSATNELHYTVKIMGANASAVAAKKGAIQAKPMFKKAEAGNLGSVTNPPTTKAGATSKVPSAGNGSTSKAASAGNGSSVTNPPTTKAGATSKVPSAGNGSTSKAASAGNGSSNNAVKTSAVPSFAGNALVASLVLGVVVPIAK